MSNQPGPDGPSIDVDPMLDEIRAIKNDISAQHGHDVRRLAESLREIERRCADRIVRPQPPAPHTATG